MHSACSVHTRVNAICFTAPQARFRQIEPARRYNPLLIKYLVSRIIFESEPFSLAASFQRLLPGCAAMNSVCDGNAGRVSANGAVTKARKMTPACAAKPDSPNICVVQRKNQHDTDQQDANIRVLASGKKAS